MSDSQPGAGPPTYPVHLKLAGRPVLVVGAGEVGLRKAEGLLAAGALVTVVAPAAVPGIAELAARGRLRHEARPYRAGEAGEHDLAFAATGVPEVDARVAADAAAAGVPVNVADVPHLCSFYLPAVVRRGPLALTVITDGRAPFASRRLRRLLEAEWGAAMADWAAAAAAFREAVLAAVPSPAARERLFDRFLAETLPPPDPLRPQVPAEAEWRAWLREAGGSTAEDPR